MITSSTAGTKISRGTPVALTVTVLDQSHHFLFGLHPPPSIGQMLQECVDRWLNRDIAAIVGERRGNLEREFEELKTQWLDTTDEKREQIKAASEK